MVNAGLDEEVDIMAVAGTTTMREREAALPVPCRTAALRHCARSDWAPDGGAHAALL